MPHDIEEKEAVWVEKAGPKLRDSHNLAAIFSTGSALADLLSHHRHQGYLSCFADADLGGRRGRQIARAYFKTRANNTRACAAGLG